MISKIFITAAIAAVASAQSSDKCSPSDTFTVQNQGDASTVGSCETFKGDVSINSRAGATLDFGNVQSITGKLSMTTDSQITSLKANSLNNLGSLSLTNLTSLNTLSFSSLSTVGDIELINLAALGSFNFGSGLKSAGMVTLGNVQVQDLSGIAAATTLDGISLSNCQYLTKINFNVQKVGTVDIGPNNVVQGQQITFPNLRSADKLTFRNSTLVSTPSLRNVSENLSLIGNKVTSYGAANLTWVGALVIQSNPQLSNLSFPQLSTINGTDASTLDIENNTALTNINGFPKLVDVPTGDAIFAGNIKNLSLPSLTKIGGAIRVLTTDSNFDCGPITNYQSSQVVLGDVSCKNGDSGAIGTTNGSSTSSGGSSSSSKSAAPKELPAFLTTGAFAALLAFLA